MMVNKKGMEALSNAVSYILLVIITILFFIVASFIKTDIIENSAKQANIETTKTNFLLFLREDTYYQGSSMSIAELIIEAQYDKEKEIFLKELIEQKFDSKYGDNWNLDITYPDRKELYGHSYGLQKTGTWLGTIIKSIFRGWSAPGQATILPFDQKLEAEAILPGYEDNIKVEFASWILISI